MKTRETISPGGRLAAAIAILAIGVVSPAPVDAFKARAGAPFGDRERLYPPFHQFVGGADFAAIGASLPNASDWMKLLADFGPQQIFIDPLSGRIVSVSGTGIPWIPGTGNSLSLADVAWAMSGPKAEAGIPELEAIARKFMADRAGLFRIPGDMTLSLNRQASTASSRSMWNLRFDLSWKGVPIEGGAVVFVVKHGNLILWGTTGLDDIALPSSPVIEPTRAIKAVEAYVGGFLPGVDVAPTEPRMRILPERDGSLHGYRQVWDVRFQREGVGNWLARVDAWSGEVLELQDTNQYAQVKGGIYPVTNDAGTEVNRPLGFADYGTGLYANSGGTFVYSSGTVTSTLNGRYVAINDNCGAISLSASAAPGDIDFGMSTGTDCVTPGVGDVGNTHSARSCYYHTDLIAQKGRIYLPSNTWLQDQLTANVNLDNTCNAYWDGSTVNFFKSGGGCGNTGEIAGVFLHEWGHGMDEFDGNGAQGSGEAMGDAFAFLQLRDSCIGANFHPDPCAAYGNPCTTCTGVRDQDYLKHTTPVILTPANIGTACASAGGGSDPCGEEVHCEGYLAGNAIWDLAYRDLPARPMAIDDAWALADKLWWESGPTRTFAYTCTNKTGAPWNNGCAATTWYQTFLAADDADGNLANGTPHATTIFAAFDRHGISCGVASDAANQDSADGCLAIGSVGTVTGAAGNDSATVTWGQATNAARYRILRNTLGCAFGFTEIAVVPDNGNPTQSFTDANAANGTPFYYTVQPIGSNADCQGPTSNCVTVTPQPCAGVVSLGRTIYACDDTVTIRMVDADLVGAGTQNVSAWSTTEVGPEIVALAETPASSGIFIGSIQTTSAAAAADGKISVVGGDSITIRYVDVSSCGTPNVNSDGTAGIDCTPPTITNVAVPSKTDSGATITWDTNEAANSRVTIGTVAPPATNVDDLATYVTSHSVVVGSLTSCTDYFFSVSSADSASNSVTEDNDGAWYTFKTSGRAYALGPDDVEAGAGTWVPSGTAGSLWHIAECPTRFNSATHAWKAGQSGACPGAYTSSADTYLTSPTMDLGATGHGYSLRYWEWYSTETGYDYCRPQVSVNGGTSWATLGTQYSGTATGWQQKAFDLAAYTGSNVKIRFWFHSDSSVNDEGWYVDDIDISRTQPCGPELHHNSHTATDACSSGGAGNGDGTIDPGETATISVTANNLGPVGTTGISAALSTSTPGISVTTPNASFPDLAGGASASSLAPHFAISVSSSVACGTLASFSITFTSADGSWSDSFTHRIGSGGSATTNTASTDVPKDIPDNNTTGASSVINITDTGIVSDVNVGVTITHSFDGDITLSLIGPNATSVTLSAKRGGSGDNYTSTVFDDQASGPITAGTAPFTGSFQPESALSALNGIPANGTWTLKVVDSAALDTGRIIAWSVTLTSSVPYTCTPCDSCTPIASPTPGTPTLSSPANAATGVTLTPSLTWSATTNTSRYKVYLGTAATPPFYAEVADPTVALPTLLAANTTYYWKVVAYPATGSAPGAASAVSSFTTRPAPLSVTGVSPSVVSRWSGTPVPLTISGSGFGGSTTIGWSGPSASPGDFVRKLTTSSFISGTLAPAADSKAGWYDVQALKGGVAAASAIRALALRAFSDVIETDFYFESSDRMVQAGIMPGFAGAPGPEFRPTVAITRGDMAEYLVKAHYWDLGQPVPSRSCLSYFPDVSCAHPQLLYIEWARDLGITLGAADGNFYPDAGVTRSEMAAFLDRLEYGGDANVPKCQPDPGWSDLATIPAWARPYVHLLRANRITSGCSASPLLYCPLGAVQRSEIATFLSRVVGEVSLP